MENNNDYIDMHMHSIYSDGEYDVNDLLNKVINNNIKTIALTDHDTLLGNKSISCEYRYNKGLNIINGIELSAKVSKGRMHILGYDFNLDDKVLNKKMNDLKLNSIYSIMALINQIRIDFNIILTEDEIKEIINRPGNIGRPLVAKLLIKKGLVNSVKEAFLKYLNVSYNKIRTSNKGIDCYECINIIKSAGGIAILAHPNQLLMNDIELEETLKKLIASGLDGIEVFHSGHSKGEINKYLNLAKKYNLLISGGSDFHGERVKPGTCLGICNDGMKIKKLSLIDKINSRK